MILIGLVIIIAVLMALAVPRIWRKLTMPDASDRAGSPSPRANER
jgi:uncharacterized protein YjeT (DUF2065 family)